MILQTEKNRKNGQLHVVLGVNGNSGRYVAQELVKLGYKVRGVSRSGKGPKGIKTIKADALNYDQLKESVIDASVIYHCLGLPYSQWKEKHPVIMDNLIKAASVNGNGTKTKIVFADNLYAFGEEGARLGPMNEDTPQIASEKKGKIRKKLAKMLFDADQEGKIISVVAKASDFFGPEATNSSFYVLVRPKIVEKKMSAVFGNLEALHSYIYIKDFAKSIITLGTSDKANRKSWILPHYKAVSIKTFIEQFYEVNGVNIPEKVKKNSITLLKFLGLFNKDLKEYERVLYQSKINWVVDDSKFRSTFPEFETTPIEVAFKETYSSYLQKN